MPVMKARAKRTGNGWWRRVSRQLKSFKNIESLGWICWLIIFAALAYPSVLVARQLTYEQMSTRVSTVSLGLFMAAVGSALVTWGLNSLVVWIAERRKEAARTSNNRKKRRK